MTDWSEKYDQWLVKYNVYDSNFYFVSTSELHNLTGFSSLYAIVQEDAESIQTAGSFSGFKGTVWSPTLALDFDTPESGLEAWKRICVSGLMAMLFKSGGKGYHILVTRPHKPSHLLPQIDKEWVQENFPKADLSIYSSLHLFRLDGTVHDKTGISKQFIAGNIGEFLILPDIPKCLEKESVIESRRNTTEGSIFLDSYIMNMTVPHEEGNRHRALLNVGMMLASKGSSIEFITEWLHNMNLLFDVPKPQEEFNGIIEFIRSAQ